MAGTCGIGNAPIDPSLTVEALLQEEWVQDYLRDKSPARVRALKKSLPQESVRQILWRKTHHLMRKWEDAAKAAMDADDIKTAAHYAAQQLTLITEHNAQQYGGPIYEANQILGLAALREGDVEAAKKYLIAAGKTTGSPVLNSFGPEMPLAQELSRRGEREVVIEFLDLVAQFWATPPTQKELKYSLRSELHLLMATWRVTPNLKLRISRCWRLLRRGLRRDPKAGEKMYQRHLSVIAQWKQELREGKQPSLDRYAVAKRFPSHHPA